jgi:glycerophosphoryl diester phosphodiesterase
MLIFAHRGASAIKPENTLAAFKAACASNCDGVEFDIQQVDGRLLVFHDRYLERTSSGKGLLIEHSFEQLRQLDVGNGEKISTLDEVLAIVADQQVINIELKSISIADLPLLFHYLDNAKVMLKINNGQFLLSSFNHQLLQVINQQRPEFYLGALTASLPLNNAEFAQQLNAYSANIVIQYVTQEFVNDAHNRGLKVYVYTVDNLRDIKMLQAMGVDGIFSNNPEQAKIFLQQS